MPNTARAAASSWLPLFIAVCLVAINMRMTISGVGPLLEEIAADQGVTPAALGALASIPLLAWAAVSPLAQGLAARFGLDRAVSWSLIVLMIATAWRSVPGTPLNLWLGTALIGIALAVANVLMPASIKRDFGSRVPLVMGVYSALISASGALGAAIVAPVAHFSPGGSGGGSADALGWRWALLATGVTLPIALIAWILVTRRARSATRSAAPTPAPASHAGLTRRIWFDRVAWWVAIYMGAQSWIFYTHATWLAPIDLSRGADPVAAGLGVTLFHTCGIVGSFIAPFIARGPMRLSAPMLVPLTSLAAALGIVFAPAVLPLWLVIGGLSCGLSLSFALTFVAQRASDTATAGALSGMSQSFGYLIAGLGPILFGWLYGLSGSWGVSLIALLIGIALQLGAGIALLRERMVFSRF